MCNELQRNGSQIWESHPAPSPLQIPIRLFVRSLSTTSWVCTIVAPVITKLPLTSIVSIFPLRPLLGGCLAGYTPLSEFLLRPFIGWQGTFGTACCHPGSKGTSQLHVAIDRGLAFINYNLVLIIYHE